MSCARSAWVRHYTAGALPSVDGIDAPAWAKLVTNARALGADPRDWAAVMLSESGFRPTTANHNANGSVVAAGINQLSTVGRDGFVGTPGSTFEGVTGQAPTPENVASYLALPASKQLDFVAKAWAPQYKKFPELAAGGVRDLYWINFLPNSYRQGVPDSFVIPQAKPFAKGNPGLADGDGNVRAGNFLRAIDTAISKNPDRWNSILANIEAIDTGPSLVSFHVPGSTSPVNVPGPASRSAAAALAPVGMALGLVLVGSLLMWRARAA